MGGSTKLMSSGAGGVILTTPGSIAADVTVNLPTQNCTLAINGPAFSAYQSSAQSITLNTFTKVQLQTEEYDTNNNFDSATNYRFTPTVAGYYQVNGSTASGTQTALVSIYKNGSEYKRGVQAGSSPIAQAIVTTQVYMNGSTDYIELFAYFTSTANSTSGIQHTYFNGCLVRAA